MPESPGGGPQHGAAAANSLVALAANTIVWTEDDQRRDLPTWGLKSLPT